MPFTLPAIDSFTDCFRSGYDADYYNNLKYISYDEATHVTALKAALTAAGVAPNKACTYSFPYSTVYVSLLDRLLVNDKC